MSVSSTPTASALWPFRCTTMLPHTAVVSPGWLRSSTSRYQVLRQSTRNQRKLQCTPASINLTVAYAMCTEAGSLPCPGPFGFEAFDTSITHTKACTTVVEVKQVPCARPATERNQSRARWAKNREALKNKKRRQDTGGGSSVASRLVFQSACSPVDYLTIASWRHLAERVWCCCSANE